jgi:uncharacterized protein (DUF1778 family)
MKALSMSKQAAENFRERPHSIALKLNPQQRALLQRAMDAEGLLTMDDLVRRAILETDAASSRERTGA